MKILFLFCWTVIADDYEHLKDVLRNDFLTAQLKKKKKLEEKKYGKEEERKRKMFSFPGLEEMRPYLTELWLSRNAHIVKWDFESPQYGIIKKVQSLFKSVGLGGGHFRILLTNHPDPPHFALPWKEKSPIILLSVPFISTLDLSKSEIALIVLEDYLRYQRGYFRKFLYTDKFKKMLGANYYGKKIDKSVLEEVLGRYNEFIFKKGFNFQQQYDVTMELRRILRGNFKLWGEYTQLLKKIDLLMKSNDLYKNYNRYYPSPEMQLIWLKVSQK